MTLTGDANFELQHAFLSLGLIRGGMIVPVLSVYPSWSL